jgi:hypothetical protein
LTDQLCQQKGKTESMRKKGNQFSKILSIEFENERHWNSSALNSHLVTGIKNSYDCLKESNNVVNKSTRPFNKNTPSSSEDKPSLKNYNTSPTSIL